MLMFATVFNSFHASCAVEQACLSAPHNKQTSSQEASHAGMSTHLGNISDDTQPVLVYSALVINTCRDCAQAVCVSSNTVRMCVPCLCCLILPKSCRSACQTLLPLQGYIHTPGKIGVVSRSGTLTYEVKTHPVCLPLLMIIIDGTIVIIIMINVVAVLVTVTVTVTITVMS